MTIEFQQFEHDGWQAAASDYAKQWTELTSSVAPHLLRAAEVEKGTRLLDVACGPGHLANAAHLEGASVVGVDFSDRMVEIARVAHPHLDIREGNAEQLQFDDESFDAVVMSFGMLHLDNPTQAIAETARVLRPGGRFAFTVWATPEHAKGFQLVLDAIGKHGTKVDLPSGPDFFAYADPQRVKTDLEASGLDKVESRQIDMTWKLTRTNDVYPAFFKGTARTGALLRAQDTAARTLIEKEICEQAQAFVTRGGTVEIPMVAVMSYGHKPT